MRLMNNESKLLETVQYRLDATFKFSSFSFLSYTSCCWISLSRYGNGNWLLSAIVNLTRRADNGKINSSPVSRSPAMLRWQEGCPQSIRIPVEDPDGDVVRCRWATYSESAISSGSFPYGTLDEVLCVSAGHSFAHYILLLQPLIYNNNHTIIYHNIIP